MFLTKKGVLSDQAAPFPLIHIASGRASGRVEGQLEQRDLPTVVHGLDDRIASVPGLGFSHRAGHDVFQLSADDFLPEIAPGELESVAEKLQSLTMFLKPVGKFPRPLPESIEDDFGEVAG